MELGLIGLGNMGGNITRRLMRAGHKCVVFDTKTETREALAKEGASAATSLESLVAGLTQKPRAVWVMLPAGKITEETVNRLAENITLASESFRSGKIGLLVFSTVRRDLVEARLAYLDALADLAERRYALQLAIGGTLE